MQFICILCRQFQLRCAIRLNRHSFSKCLRCTQLVTHILTPANGQTRRGAIKQRHLSRSERGKWSKHTGHGRSSTGAPGANGRSGRVYCSPHRHDCKPSRSVGSNIEPPTRGPREGAIITLEFDRGGRLAYTSSNQMANKLQF